MRLKFWWPYLEPSQTASLNMFGFLSTPLLGYPVDEDENHSLFFFFFFFFLFFFMIVDDISFCENLKSYFTQTNMIKPC